MIPSWLTFALVIIGLWELARWFLRRLAAHEEARYRQWAARYDVDSWERRHCHLHLVQGGPVLFDQDRVS